jgi:hypothetical protein
VWITLAPSRRVLISPPLRSTAVCWLTLAGEMPSRRASSTVPHASAMVSRMALRGAAQQRGEMAGGPVGSPDLPGGHKIVDHRVGERRRGGGIGQIKCEVRKVSYEDRRCEDQPTPVEVHVGVAAQGRVHLQDRLLPSDMRWTHRRQQLLQPGVDDGARPGRPIRAELSVDLCPVGPDRDIVQSGDGIGEFAARARVGVQQRLRPRGQMVALVVPLQFAAQVRQGCAKQAIESLRQRGHRPGQGAKINAVGVARKHVGQHAGPLVKTAVQPCAPGAERQGGQALPEPFGGEDRLGKRSWPGRDACACQIFGGEVQPVHVAPVAVNAFDASASVHTGWRRRCDLGYLGRTKSTGVRVGRPATLLDGRQLPLSTGGDCHLPVPARFQQASVCTRRAETRGGATSMFALTGECVMTTGPGMSGPHQGWPPQPQHGPPGYPPHPSPGGRRRTWLIVGGIGLAVVVLLCATVTIVVVRAVGDKSSPSAAEPGAGKTTGAPGVVTYKVVPDLCVLVDSTPFKEPYPVENERRPTTLPGNYYTAVSCDIGVSSGKGDFDAGTVRVEVDIFAADNAAEGPQRLFEGQQKYAREKGIPTKDVPGLGQAAFSYVEKSLGHYLIARDDNLWLRANFGVLGDATANADDRIARLIKVCRDVLPKLKK